MSGVLGPFRGQPDTGNGHFPEDWLASTVPARNGTNSRSVLEGWNWTQPSADWEILLAKLPVVQSSSRYS